MLILFNPVAGRRRAQLLWRVLDVMATNGVRLEVAETQGPGHATDLAHAAASTGRTMIVAAGGDGTIAEIANGLNGSRCRLGVIPLGTANVLAHELRLPKSPGAIAAALAFGRTTPVWPGMIHRDEDSPAAGPRLFVQMLAAGFDAQVVHDMPAPMKRLLGRTAYLAQSLRGLARYRFRQFRVSLDGVARDAGSVIVSKGHCYGGGFLLAPGASPRSPGFTVAVFDRSGPVSAAMYGAALPLNLMPRMPGLTLIRATEIVIASDDVPAQADGDPAGTGPLRITDAPNPIEIVIA